MMQVFNDNFIDTAFSKAVSSEDTAYPASNVYDITRRRQTWRSKGYWKIASPANTVVFNEGGTDKTATIAAGAYTTDSAFLAAIATAFNGAAGKQNTYSVSRDTSTGKVKITAVLAGTGTIFTIKWTSATGFGTLIGFDTSANDTGSLSYTADLLRIHTSEWFTFDFGAPANPTGFFAVSDRNRPLNITPDAVVTLMANASDAWGTPAESFTVTVRDFLLGYVNKDGIAALPGGYRYWHVDIYDPANPDLYLELGAMMLGAHIVLARGCPAFPFESTPISNSVVAYSESGQTWVGKRPKTQMHQLNWEKLTNDDQEALHDHWNEVGTESPFFVCMDPDNAFSSDGVKWSRLVRFNSEPPSRLVSPGNWSSGWQLREEL